MLRGFEGGIEETVEQAGILILGIGNRLLMDDGVGSCFAEALSTFELPEGVEVVDGGLGGLNLLDYMEGKSVMFLVDALDPREGAPGDVKLFKINSGAIAPSKAVRMLVEGGSHGVSPEFLVAAADAVGYLPEKSYLLGIIPYMIDLGDGITTPAVKGCLKALEMLKEMLSNLGLHLEIEQHRFKERLTDLCVEITR